MMKFNRQETKKKNKKRGPSQQNRADVMATECWYIYTIIIPQRLSHYIQTICEKNKRKIL